jgi:hypothetical protein
MSWWALKVCQIGRVHTIKTNVSWAHYLEQEISSCESVASLVSGEESSTSGGANNLLGEALLFKVPRSKPSSITSNWIQIV